MRGGAGLEFVFMTVKLFGNCGRGSMSWGSLKHDGDFNLKDLPKT